LAPGVVEVATVIAHGVVVAMHLHKGLFADVADSLLIELRAVIEIFGLGRLEPQGRVLGRAALNTQPRLLDDLAVPLSRGFALGAPEGLGHLDQVVALRLRHQSGQGQQLAPLFLSEVCEMRAIGLDRPKYAYAGENVVWGKCHRGCILWHIIAARGAPAGVPVLRFSFAHLLPRPARGTMWLGRSSCISASVCPRPHL